MSKTASNALIDFLGSDEPFIGADLYVFRLYSGITLYVTSLDRSVTYTGVIASNPDFGTHTYVSMGQSASGTPMIQRSKLSMAVGLTPSKIDIDIFARPGALVANQEILVTMAHGLWANAQVFVRRAFLLPSDKPASWDTPWPSNLGGAGDGTLCWFSGVVGPISELGPLNARLEVRDNIWLANRPQPKRPLSVACRWVLFDEGCGLNPASFEAFGAVQSGSTTTVINTATTNDSGQPNPPVFPSNPITSSSTTYTLPAARYYITATYLTSYGETIGSAEWFLDCAPNRLITVVSPPAVTGATAWNLYAGFGSQDEQLQSTSPIPIGTSWHETTDGLALNGILTPELSSTGWWSLGVISITYNTGALSGQTVSAVIDGSNASGQVSLRVPLPQAPSVLESFVMRPGCDKLASTCGSSKFFNIARFGGFPYVPVPESGS